mgnify:CR=1 FL=1
MVVVVAQPRVYVLVGASLGPLEVFEVGRQHATGGQGAGERDDRSLDRAERRQVVERVTHSDDGVGVGGTSAFTTAPPPTAP